MRLRSIVLLLTVLAIAALAALNWTALAAPTLVSLGVASFEAPLGLLMLALTTLLGVICIVYVLSLQGSVLVETRRHTKELQVQRELADKAEASRFTELRTFLEAQHQQSHGAVMTRMDALEARLAARAEQSDNTTAAYIGQLEDQWHGRQTHPDARVMSPPAVTPITPLV